MRISDWSSDVCSSDLDRDSLSHASDIGGLRSRIGAAEFLQQLRMRLGALLALGGGDARRGADRLGPGVGGAAQPAARGGRTAGDPSRQRSEENTSELQSLMRILYAVF